MPAITDPRSWLVAPPGPKGPVGEWLPEYLAPGDVRADGSITMPDHVSLLAGAALVTIAQARAASYYGWHMSGLRVYRDGQLLTQIFKEGRSCNTI